MIELTQIANGIMVAFKELPMVGEIVKITDCGMARVMEYVQGKNDKVLIKLYLMETGYGPVVYTIPFVIQGMNKMNGFTCSDFAPPVEVKASKEEDKCKEDNCKMTEVSHPIDANGTHVDLRGCIYND